MIQQFNNAISSFVPYLCFAPDIQQVINQQFIEPQVQSFFVGKETDFRPLSAEKYISLEDFREVKFEYFYEEILTEISRNNDGKVRVIPKYAITLDNTITPQYCKQTSRSFGALTLGKQPVLYFIHFTIEEILNFLRQYPNAAASRTSWQPKSQKIFKYIADTNENAISGIQKTPIIIVQSSETPWIGFNQNNHGERYGIVKSINNRTTHCFGFIWGDKTSGHNSDGRYNDIYFSSEDSEAIPQFMHSNGDHRKGILIRYEIQEYIGHPNRDRAPFKAINVRIIETEDNAIPRWEGVITRTGYLNDNYYYIGRKWAWIDVNQEKEIRVDFELSSALDNITPQDLQGKRVSFIPVANFGSGFEPEKHHSVKAVYVELI